MIGKAQGIRRPNCGSSLANAHRTMEPRAGSHANPDDPERALDDPGAARRNPRAGRSAGPADGQGCQGEVCWDKALPRQLKVAVEQARSPSVQPRGRVKGWVLLSPPSTA